MMVLLPLGLIAGLLSAGSRLGVDLAAPPLAFRNTSGQVRSLPSHTPLIISFWASWCGPCREELPRLKRAAAAGRVQVLALNYGESARTVNAYLSGAELSGLPVGFVGPADLGMWPLPGLPTNVLIDRRGIVRRVQYGPLSEAALNSWLSLKLN